jgi:hypothetical protein
MNRRHLSVQAGAAILSSCLLTRVSCHTKLRFALRTSLQVRLYGLNVWNWIRHYSIYEIRSMTATRICSFHPLVYNDHGTCNKGLNSWLICWVLDYFKMISLIAYVMQRRMVELLGTNNWKARGRKQSWLILMYYSGIRLEVLRKSG